MGCKMNREREKLIINMMLKEKRMSVKRLSETLYASEPSIRRDLASLESQGLIRRIHGGAVLNEEYASMIGADAYGPDAMAAVRFAQSIIE